MARAASMVCMGRSFDEEAACQCIHDDRQLLHQSLDILHGHLRQIRFKEMSSSFAIMDEWVLCWTNKFAALQKYKPVTGLDSTYLSRDGSDDLREMRNHLPRTWILYLSTINCAQMKLSFMRSPLYPLIDDSTEEPSFNFEWIMPLFNPMGKAWLPCAQPVTIASPYFSTEMNKSNDHTTQILLFQLWALNPKLKLAVLKHW